jgi:hypothetical protein
MHVLMYLVYVCICLFFGVFKDRSPSSSPSSYVMYRNTSFLRTHFFLPSTWSPCTCIRVLPSKGFEISHFFLWCFSRQG